MQRLNLKVDWNKVVNFQPRGCIVAVPIPPQQANELVLSGGEEAEELHVTLLFFPEQIELSRLSEICENVAREFQPFQMHNQGIGRFEHEDEDVVHIIIESAELRTIRQRLAEEVEAAGMEYSKKWDFNPHVTLAYVSKDVPNPRLTSSVSKAVPVDCIEIWNNGTRFSYPLG